MAKKANHDEGVRSAIDESTYCEHSCCRESLMTDDVTANHIALQTGQTKSTKFISEVEAEIRNTQPRNPS
jgi:hypothetical protein